MPDRIVPDRIVPGRIVPGRAAGAAVDRETGRWRMPVMGRRAAFMPAPGMAREPIMSVDAVRSAGGRAGSGEAGPVGAASRQTVLAASRQTVLAAPRPTARGASWRTVRVVLRHEVWAVPWRAVPAASRRTVRARRRRGSAASLRAAGSVATARPEASRSPGGRWPGRWSAIRKGHRGCGCWGRLRCRRAACRIPAVPCPSARLGTGSCRPLSRSDCPGERRKTARQDRFGRA